MIRYLLTITDKIPLFQRVWPKAGAFLLALLLSITTSLAQSVSSFSGTITGEQKQPIPGITVLLKGTQRGAVTDGQGKFTFTGIQPGTYTIEVSGIGFEKQKFQLHLKPGEKIERSVILKENITEIEEVVVIAESEARALRLSAKAIEVIETKKVKLQSADLGEVLAQTQGVSIRRSGGLGSGTRFSLNGLSGDQVRFFLNGIPLAFSSYSTGIANVPVNLIERVEIYKGVVPIEFGADALGGAVNLVSPTIEDGFQGSFSYQAGSFGTHRLALDIRNYDTESGFFVGAGGFYDNARNNYKIDVEVPDERGRLSEVTVPRFHDRYRAVGGNLTVGIKNQSWADELSLEAFYGDAYNELQHNVLMSGIPYGDVLTLRNAFGANLRYRNTWEPNVSLEVVMGYNQLERQFIDTSFYAYNWFGERILRKQRAGEISGQSGPSHQFTWDDNYFARLNLNWQLAPNHTLKASLAPTYNSRSGDELFSGTFDPLARKGRLLTCVNGLEYELLAFNNKLQNIAFVKNYWQDLGVEVEVSNGPGTSTSSRQVNEWGVGNGLRYRFTDRLMMKATYENAIRLPRSDEVFGDGQLVLKNLELEPEQSHNVNVEFTFQNKPSAHNQWQINANAFLRRISNLILLIAATDRTNIYRNVFEATSQGLELSSHWKQVGQGFTISANTTYQRYYNNSRDGSFEAFFGDRIPNMPYFFANASVNYTWIDNWKAQDQLSFFWTSRYVHEFFRSWESAGIREFKQEIPRQQLHHAGITYQLPVNRVYWAVTAEVQNVFDARAFDFFGVQRPGRAFYLKLTTQF